MKKVKPSEVGPDDLLGIPSFSFDTKQTPPLSMVTPTWADWFKYMDKKFGEGKVWKAQKKLMKLTPCLFGDSRWYDQTRRELELRVLILTDASKNGVAPVKPGVPVFPHGKRG